MLVVEAVVSEVVGVTTADTVVVGERQVNI